MAQTFQYPYQTHEFSRFHGSVSPPSEPQSKTWTTPTASNLRQLKKDDENDLSAAPVSPIMSRRTSIDSDRYSTVSGLTTYFPSNPTNVSPSPAYVAPFGASQVVSEHQGSNRRPSSDDDEDDAKQDKDDTRFSETALGLVNAFLDQLLYSFLSHARSTSLLALRPAVLEVLKHRLARDAIASAEEELNELLAGGEDEEEVDTKHQAAEDGRRWDLELVWKRTRLRVMVYMRLGEMEDEDEQRYVKDEELFQGSERRFSQSTGLVSWAAAIFLTSVLEYVAEQTLQVAGAAAYARARRQSRTQRLKGAAQSGGELVVEEYDVEKVALNATLGRLWRTWRKALRNNTAPSTPTHRSTQSIGRASREQRMNPFSNRSSFSTAHEESSAGDSRPASRAQNDDMSELQYPEHVLAANIPLPIGDHSRDIDQIAIPNLARDPDAEHEDEDTPDTPYDDHVLGRHIPLPVGDEQRDVDEIEVPGLARDPDAEDDESGRKTPTPNVFWRRNSFGGTAPYRTTGGLPTPDDSVPNSPQQNQRPSVGRRRSSSVPTPSRTPMPAAEQLPDTLSSRVKMLEQHENMRKAAAERGDQRDEDEDEDGEDENNVQPITANNEKEEAAVDETEHKSEFPWMVKGAAAAGAATVAAAGAWTFGSKRAAAVESEDTSKKTSSNDLASLPSRQVNDTHSSKGFDGLIKSANGSRRISPDESQSPYSERDVEELDKRKSLVDIKAMMMNGKTSDGESSQEQDSSRLSAKEPGAVMRASSGGSNVSSSMYSSDRKDVDGTSEGEGEDNAIGVARTSGEAELAKEPYVEEQQARDGAKRPPRLILGDSSREDLRDNTVIKQNDRPKSPRRYLDLTSEQQQAEKAEQSEQNRSSIRSSQRASLASGAQQSPAVETSPFRQSFTASVDKNGPKTPTTPKTPSSDVQEHPVIQRMASLKRSRDKSDPEKGLPLTSASIRGPEDFDMFVQGDDTVKYTLTPENVRDEPLTPKSTSVERDAPSQIPPQVPTLPPPATDTRTGRSQSIKQVTSAAQEDDIRATKRRSLSKPPPRNASVNRKSGLTAREPRVMTESTRDFADFIRSTGPHKESSVYPILANASQTSLHSLRSAHINGASASRSSSPGGDRTKSMRSTANGENVPPVPPIPAKPKPNMQPRPAKSVSGGSSELIDFIRSGPDQDGQHRISRSVAPFRTTMDSDQFRDLGARTSSDAPLANGAPSVQTASSIKSSSHRTSANSRSALLNGSSNANQPVQPMPQASGPSQIYSANSTPAQPPQGEPVRKRVRNKDPYYIDYSDDDEDLLTALPKNNRNEESLADFLNNNEPPPNNAPRPIVSASSAQARSLAGKGRAGSINSQKPGPSSADGRTRSMPNQQGPRAGYAAPAVQPVQASTHPAVSGPASVTPKMQARGGAKDIAANSNTRELADFLKASGPTDEAQGAPAPVVGRNAKLTPKEAEKAQKKADKKKVPSFFSRARKKTYLDMP